MASAAIMGGEHKDEERRADEVEGALEGEVDALEHRRLQLEERERLSGHVLHAPMRISIVDGATARARPGGGSGPRADGLPRGSRRRRSAPGRSRRSGARAARASGSRAGRRGARQACGRRIRTARSRLSQARATRPGCSSQSRRAPRAGGARARRMAPLTRSKPSGTPTRRAARRRGSVEDVVRLERLALEQRVEQHDDGGLEERGDHARQARRCARPGRGPSGRTAAASRPPSGRYSHAWSHIAPTWSGWRMAVLTIAV